MRSDQDGADGRFINEVEDLGEAGAGGDLAIVDVNRGW